MASLVALTDHVNQCNRDAENESVLLEVESSISGLDFVCINIYLLGQKKFKGFLFTISYFI